MSDLEYGKKVILYGPKGKKNLFTLKEGARFSTQNGFMEHDNILKAGSGAEIKTNKGISYFCFKPTYMDYIMNFKRKAQIIYPKDSAMMLMWGDVYPGLNILESGLGQGALSIAILRALAGQGKLTTYELRDDFIEQATDIIKDFAGEQTNHTIIKGNIYEGFNGVYDRIFLDLPEPWHLIKYSKKGLKNGGIMLAYIPTILQVKEYVDNLRDCGFFIEIETHEFNKRPWKVEGLSVRPEMWIYNHSAFIVTARKIKPYENESELKTDKEICEQ
jgi:tRNA (adenine57-N1/adenine58-N1)-methyltransferase